MERVKEKARKQIKEEERVEEQWQQVKKWTVTSIIPTPGFRSISAVATFKCRVLDYSRYVNVQSRFALFLPSSLFISLFSSFFFSTCLHLFCCVPRSPTGGVPMTYFRHAVSRLHNPDFGLLTLTNLHSLRDRVLTVTVFKPHVL